MARPPALPLLLLLAFVGCVNAQWANLTAVKASNLVISHEPLGSECDAPGVCYGVNQSIPANTVYYWCGFKSTYRTVYNIVSQSSKNLTAQYLMREDTFQNCALPNISMIANCPQVPESSCSKAKKCNVRTFGLVFSSTTCMILVNAGTSNITALVQVNNFYDRPRYYGTVFTILLTVLCCLAVLANLAYQFYTLIVTPVGKAHQRKGVPKAGFGPSNSQAFRGPEDAGLGAALVPNDDSPRKPQPVQAMLDRLRRLLKRDPAKEPVHDSQA